MARVSVRTRFKDVGWKHVQQTAHRLGTIRIHAGVVGSQAAEQHGDSGLPNVAIAAINEFGSDAADVPARPFLKETFEHREGAVARTLEAAVRHALDGANPEHELSKVGEWAVEQVRESILRSPSWAQPNAPATIQRKGHAHPLIEDSIMLGAIAYELAHTGGGPTLDEGAESFVVEGVVATPE